MGNRGKREFIQVLRLMELHERRRGGAVNDAIPGFGAIGFDAVKQIVLARIEKRPARLDLAAYPYLAANDVRPRQPPITPCSCPEPSHERCQEADKPVAAETCHRARRRNAQLSSRIT